MICIPFSPKSQILENETHLGHHASPSHDIGIYLLPRLLLMRDDGLEETIQMLISRIIQLLKGLEAL